MKPQCGFCLHWHAKTRTCRHQSPIIDHQGYSRWPETAPGDGCAQTFDMRWEANLHREKIVQRQERYPVLQVDQ